MRKRNYLITVDTKEFNVKKNFNIGLIKMILVVGGKIEEYQELMISKLNFKITIYVVDNDRKDIRIHRITIIREGHNSAMIELDGCLERVFNKRLLNDLDEVGRKKIKRWYCPMTRLENIKSVGEILDHYRSIAKP